MRALASCLLTLVGTVRASAAQTPQEAQVAWNDPSTRLAYVRLMEDGRTPADVDRLTSLLADDPDPSVRQAAASMLGRIGDPGSRPILVRASQRDPSPEVRDAAMTALAAYAVPPQRADDERPPDELAVGRAAEIGGRSGVAFDLGTGAFIPTSEDGGDDVFEGSLALSGGLGFQGRSGVGFRLELGYVPLQVRNEFDGVHASLWWWGPQLAFTANPSSDVRPRIGVGLGSYHLGLSAPESGNEESLAGLGMHVEIAVEIGGATSAVLFWRYQRATFEFEDVGEGALGANWIGLSIKHNAGG